MVVELGWVLPGTSLHHTRSSPFAFVATCTAAVAQLLVVELLSPTSLHRLFSLFPPLSNGAEGLGVREQRGVGGQENFLFFKQ